MPRRLQARDDRYVRSGRGGGDFRDERNDVRQRRQTQYLETPALYDAALLAGFDRFVLADGARLRYFNLVPNPPKRRIPRSVT